MANLTQAEADALMALEKRRVDGTERDYPDLGGQITLPLISTDMREQFLLDLRRGRIDLRKGTYRSRARQVVILARLDFRQPWLVRCSVGPMLHLISYDLGERRPLRSHSSVASGRYTSTAMAIRNCRSQ